MPGVVLSLIKCLINAWMNAFPLHGMTLSLWWMLHISKLSWDITSTVKLSWLLLELISASYHHCTLYLCWSSFHIDWQVFLYVSDFPLRVHASWGQTSCYRSLCPWCLVPRHAIKISRKNWRWKDKYCRFHLHEVPGIVRLREKVNQAPAQSEGKSKWGLTV